jgi:hypothetical protein
VSHRLDSVVRQQQLQILGGSPCPWLDGEFQVLQTGTDDLPQKWANHRVWSVARDGVSAQQLGE